MKQRSVYGLFAAILLSSPLFLAARVQAKPLSADEVRDLQAKMKSSDFLTVDMVQTRVSTFRGEKKSVRTGKAIFAKPDRFKWMLETPVQEYKIFDGKACYDYRPAEKSAQKYTATGPVFHDLMSIVDLVQNFDSLLKRYELIKAESDEGVVTVDLKPKLEGEVVGVTLKLSLKDSYMTYLRMDLKRKNSLTHEFSNPVRAAVPADAFKIPDGVKITDSN
ncbi:hypothetical protein E3A20_06880 [Planctomyces bekefii]|uniref:Outer-membrane lipoprotein carrier protein n=1 Tax=Planctomyces bekefii TaxID=1653850 RepID=A0A5C6MBY2_9PLAN|nr:hypothetical protein E3A20_06880 [Planctomyces bekefii]